MPKSKDTSLITSDRIESKIFLLRGRKVMFDSDFSELYGVTTGNLNKAVSRNLERFPDDFMFRLAKEEYTALRFQFGILKRGQHAKYLPRVFTEPGVAMLSSVLNSDRAIQVNIQIMRTFIRLRKLVASNKGLREKIEALEKKYDRQFKVVFTAINKLLTEDETPKQQIGFQPEKKKPRR